MKKKELARKTDEESGKARNLSVDARVSITVCIAFDLLEAAAGVGL